jgi:type II secretory pathway component PulF
MQKVVELPEFYLQSIKISEDGGMLQSVLVELADYLKEQDKLTKQISSAMAYPMFIIVVSFLMVGFMLSFIVPKITAIFEQTDQALPPITQFVISAGDFVNNYYQIILIATLVIIFAFGYAMKNLPKFKYKIDSFLLKLPFVGRLIEIGELSRFSYMNSILIRSGVPVVQSFKLSSNILKNSVIKNLFSSASEKVVEGEKLSKILDSSKIYKIDIAFIQAVSIGEETSELSNILQNLAQLYTTQNQDKIGIFLSLLEPMFMLIVGGIIGFIVMAMLLPIFSMSL